MGEEVVLEPGGLCADAPLPSARQSLSEQFIARVAAAPESRGFSTTTLSVEFLHSWQPSPGDVLGSFLPPL